MKKMTILLALCLALGAVLPGFALAETTFDGTVVSGESVSVTAPFGGTVDSFTPAVGDRISEGDVIASVKTTKVYASIDGTVTGVFGQPGDTVSDVQEGQNAGMWTIALTKSGNELGLPLEAAESLPPAELAARLTAIENRLREAGAHYVAQDISQVPELLTAINERLSQGERP